MLWEKLLTADKLEYKRLILTFASLTEMFAQKALGDEGMVTPIINSKFQETVFQRAFNAVAEDIGNTSYDVSLQYNNEKYLIGIKTFGITSGDQKIAQFKAKHDEWSSIVNEIKKNAIGIDDKDEIDRLNSTLYLELATKIANIRNERIDSSYAKIRGFKIDEERDSVYSVYHVLMPSSKDEIPKIYVGEMSYDKIDVENLCIKGCTGKNNPTNFCFTDGQHVYKYTSADSQLYMNFMNRKIVCDEWKVKYADDAYAIFEKISDMINNECEGERKTIAVSASKESLVEETYCWTIWNKEGETELYSGFNSFYGIGSKMGKEQRERRIKYIFEKFKNMVDPDLLDSIEKGLSSFLLEQAVSSTEKAMKVRLREYIMGLTKRAKNLEFEKEIVKVLYRPMDEMYIPIPNAAQFHKKHPDFFGKGFGKVRPGTAKLELEKKQRMFNLVFDPSGDSLAAYITQDNGKAIESAEKQSYLGEWILREIFQLKEYEPLTSQKLMELNINGLRFTKYKKSDDIHIEFIWIDEMNPPKDFIPRE